MNKQSFGVKEFCQLTGFTIRALHYYDTHNILKPAQKLANGTRIYSYENLLTAQKINTLKYIGLSLEQVKDLLTNPDFDFLTSLKLQADILRDNIAQFNKGLVVTEKIIAEYQKTGNSTYDNMSSMLHTFKLSHTDLVKEWSKRNFSDSERELFGEKKFQKTKIEYEKIWVELFTQATIFQRQKKDPFSKEVQLLAKQWINMWLEMSAIQYKDNPELAEKMWSLMKSGDIPDGLIAGYDHDVIMYMNTAMEHFESNN